MPRYRIHLTTHASTSIEFETDATDPAEIEEAFWASGPDLPTICAHCTGYGRDQNLDLGDDWEVATHNDEPIITPA